MLAVVVSAYIYASLRERKFLRAEAGQSLELQQKVYQAQVLKEISERIGYSLDTNKIVDIITSSLGNLLDYDTVSYMVLEEDGKVVFKCHVENTVNHEFIEEVKEKMLMSYEAILNSEIQTAGLDESITGNILDDNLKVKVESFFNLPVVISQKLVGLINVASARTRPLRRRTGLHFVCHYQPGGHGRFQTAGGFGKRKRQAGGGDLFFG